MKRLVNKYTVGVGLLVSLLLGLYLRHRLSLGSVLTPVPAPAGAALPKDDREQLIVDPRRHTIIIRRPGGDTVTHLPDRPTVITVKNDGRVEVVAPQWGVELRPFVGLTVQSDGFVGVGGAADGLYWKKLDLGGGVLVNMRGRDPRLFVQLSYNIKDNLRIGVTVDHTKAVGAMLSIRI